MRSQAKPPIPASSATPLKIHQLRCPRREAAEIGTARDGWEIASVFTFSVIGMPWQLQEA
jgi:hypothetical protein